MIRRVFGPPVFLRRLVHRAGAVQIRTAARAGNLVVVGGWAAHFAFGWHTTSLALPSPGLLLAAVPLAGVEIALLFAALNFLVWMARSPRVLA